MTRTAFGDVTFFWGYWTFLEAVWIAVFWGSRSRVLGAGLYWIPGARYIRRGACGQRVETLLTALERSDVPVEERPDREQLVDRWHRITAGRCVSVLLQMVPVLIVVAPYMWMSVAGTTVTPLWMVAAVAGYGTLSLVLMAADERAAAVSDAAGKTTVEAIRFLETLVVPDGRHAQQSALDKHGRMFGRFIRSLRAQAHHETRRMSPAARERAQQSTERLIAALTDNDHRYLFGEGADRDTAARQLSRLASSALSRSCRPRAQLDALVFCDPHLLENVPAVDPAATVGEPLRNRVFGVAGRLVVAAGLFAGAAFFPDGVASGLMVFAGLASIALVYPPLREVLALAREPLLGSPPVSDEPRETTYPQRPVPSTTTPCPDCVARSSATAGSRPVG
ncbi:hypothetical protein ACWGIA_05715 [Streptomyces bobili]